MFRLILSTCLVPLFLITSISIALGQDTTFKINGYFQVEWQHYDQTTNAGGAALYSDARKNLFTIRSGRLKFFHKLGSQMSITVQPDITERGFDLKEAFITLNLEPGVLSADAGLVTRPDLEVELSSSMREVPDRSQIVRAFYPGEYDLGVLFALRGKVAEGFEPRLQLGLLNGTGPRIETDAYKDLMGRLVLPFTAGDENMVKAHVGGSFYYGGIPQKGSTVRTFDGGVDAIRENTATGSMPGWGNNWDYGVESQVQLKLFPIGTTELRGEFLSGARATAPVPGTPATVQVRTNSAGADSVAIIAGTAAVPVTLRKQMGYYAYLVQNFGKSVQVAVRYDYYDRNTQQSGTQVTSATEAASSDLALAASYLYGDARIMIAYEIPSFAAGENIQRGSSGVLEAMRDVDVKDNKFTLRLQYKF